MQSSRPHHYQFGHADLPGLFHADPARFMGTLQTQGADFLQLVWNRIGENLSPDERISAPELGVAFHPLADQITLVVISLPPPVGMTEAYFVAAAYRPPQSDTPGVQRFFTLELSIHYATEQHFTILGEWTKDRTHRNLGQGPAATEEDFVAAVQSQL